MLEVGPVLKNLMVEVIGLVLVLMQNGHAVWQLISCAATHHRQVPAVHCDVRDEPSATRRVLMHLYDGIAHCVVLFYCSFDFSELDSHTAQLHLMVYPA